MRTPRRTAGPAAAALAAALSGAAALALPGAAGAQDCGRSYTIRAGDTLGAIATRCATTVEALMQANPRITDPGRISVGWELAVPAGSEAAEILARARARPPEPEAAAALERGTYIVGAGDSFASIATALRIPMRELQAANRGVDPFALRPGQALRLPAGPGAGEDGAGEEGAGDDSAAAEARPGPGAPEDAQEGAEQGAAAARDAMEPEPAAAVDAAPGQDGTDAASRDGRPNGTADGKPDEAADAPERLALEGRIRKGVECAVLETPEGESYSLVSQAYSFAPGEYVEIEGEPVEISFCMEGKATLRVTSMQPGG